jgi:hypothetical protein
MSDSYRIWSWGCIWLSNHLLFLFQLRLRFGLGLDLNLSIGAFLSILLSFDFESTLFLGGEAGPILLGFIPPFINIRLAGFSR